MSCGLVFIHQLIAAMSVGPLVDLEIAKHPDVFYFPIEVPAEETENARLYVNYQKSGLVAFMRNDKLWIIRLNTKQWESSYER